MALSLSHIETSFDTVATLQWQNRYWHTSWIASIIYFVILYFGTRWMKDREPYRLRLPLVLWNIGLAVFSIVGFWRSETPELAMRLVTKGIEDVSCYTTSFVTPKRCFWLYLFSLSKIIELGDTAFIVLRKTPLNFLHWYHHITVLVYSWYIFTFQPASGVVFHSMNYAVHSFMYSYYAVKAAGYRVPSQLAMVITILQMLQMIGGIVFNVTAFNVLQRGEECQFSYQLFVLGMIIYMSYLALFGNFFYQRYFVSKKTGHSKQQ